MLQLTVIHIVLT